MTHSKRLVTAPYSDDADDDNVHANDDADYGVDLHRVTILLKDDEDDDENDDDGVVVVDDDDDVCTMMLIMRDHRGGDVNGSVVVIMMMLTHVQVGYAYSIADVVDLRHSDFVTELDCICTHDVIYFNNFGKWFQGEPEYKSCHHIFKHQ